MTPRLVYADYVIPSVFLAACILGLAASLLFLVLACRQVICGPKQRVQRPRRRHRRKPMQPVFVRQQNLKKESRRAHNSPEPKRKPIQPMQPVFVRIREPTPISVSDRDDEPVKANWTYETNTE